MLLRLTLDLKGREKGSSSLSTGGGLCGKTVVDERTGANLGQEDSDTCRALLASVCDFRSQPREIKFLLPAGRLVKMIKRIYLCFSGFSKGRDLTRSLDSLSEKPANKNTPKLAFPPLQKVARRRAHGEGGIGSRKAPSQKTKNTKTNKNNLTASPFHAQRFHVDPARRLGVSGARSPAWARGVEAGPSEHPIRSQPRRWRQ